MLSRKPAYNEVFYLLALFDKLLSVYVVNPYAFDDLEDFVSNVEFVVELCIGPRGLALNVKLHQGMQQIVVGKFDGDELVTQNTSLKVHKWPGSREQKRH